MTADTPDNSIVIILPVTSIIIAEDRQRKFFDEAKLAELETSIFAPNLGLFHPPLVAEIDGKFHLVAGERRLRVITRANKPYIYNRDTIPAGFIPVAVAQASDIITRTEAELDENLQRADLQWQEKAEAIARLHSLKASLNPKQTYKDTALEIAAKTGNVDAEGVPQANARDAANVQRSILVSKYLDNPNVQKAANFSQAVRAATLESEKEMMAKMQAVLDRAKAAEPAAPIATPAGTSVDLLEEIGVTTHGRQLTITDDNSLPYRIHNFGMHSLYHGDLRHVLPDLAANTFDVLLTDPPYMNTAIETFGSASPIVHDYDDSEAEELYFAIAEQAQRLLKANAHLYVFVGAGYENFERAAEMFSEAGFEVRKRPLIWHKPNRGFLTGKDYAGWRASYEQILFASRGSKTASGIKDDVLSIPIQQLKTHAAQKPDALLRTLLSMSAAPTDKILDPCIGSGALYRPATALNLAVTGIEANADYIPMAADSMRGATPTAVEPDEESEPDFINPEIEPGTSDDDIPF